MNNKILLGIVVVVVVVVVGGILLINKRQPSSSPSAVVTHQGKVIFAATDAAPILTNVQAVNVTVDKIAVQGQDETWITVSQTPLTFDLMNLKQTGTFSLVGQGDLAAGTYNQVRLNISKVMVKLTNGTEVAAKLPSNELKLVGKVVVAENQTSTVTIDFKLDKSLHVTGSGQFILTPVVKLETKSNADVTVDLDNHVVIKSGKTEDSQDEGQDVDGTTKSNFMVDSDLDLIGNTIHEKSEDQTENTAKITAAKALELALASGKVDATISVTLETKDDTKVWHVVGTKDLVKINVFVNATSGAIVSVK